MYVCKQTFRKLYRQKNWKFLGFLEFLGYEIFRVLFL